MNTLKCNHLTPLGLIGLITVGACDTQTSRNNRIPVSDSETKPKCKLHNQYKDETDEDKSWQDYKTNIEDKARQSAFISYTQRFSSAGWGDNAVVVQGLLETYNLSTVIKL